MVRDRDAVGVAGQIGEHALGPVERRLSVDDPLLDASLVEKALERCWAAIAVERSVQLEATVLERLIESSQELAAEQPTQYANG